MLSLNDGLRIFRRRRAGELAQGHLGLVPARQAQQVRRRRVHRIDPPRSHHPQQGLREGVETIGRQVGSHGAGWPPPRGGLRWAWVAWAVPYLWAPWAANFPWEGSRDSTPHSKILV